MAKIDKNDEQHWTLDRRIPIALVFAIFMQTISAVWWASTTNNRVENLERRVDVAENLTERVVRLEVVLNNVDKTLVRLNRTIDKLSDKQNH